MTKNKNDQDIIVLLKQSVKEAIREEGLVTREDIKHLPTKEEYYAREDKTMKELKEIREEITVLGGRVSDHSDKIEALESIHPQDQHFASI